MIASTTPPLGDRIERRLSVERLRPYRVAVNGDLTRAIELYEWNAAVAGAFFEMLGHFEVLLRNALHEQLTVWHTRAGRSHEWYDDPAGILDGRLRAAVAEARKRIGVRGDRNVAPGKVIAELSFGFWRYLLDKRHQPTLWAPALRHAFPNLLPQRRKDVYSPVSELNWLRNRIAHQEPIHRADLSRRHSDLLRVAGFIDPDIQGWLGGLSRSQPSCPRSPLLRRQRSEANGVEIRLAVLPAGDQKLGRST